MIRRLREKPAATRRFFFSGKGNGLRDLVCVTWESLSRKRALEIFRGTLPPQRSTRKDDCLSAKREFRLCSEARGRRVEKCPAREGIKISKGLIAEMAEGPNFPCVRQAYENNRERFPLVEVKKWMLSI